MKEPTRIKATIEIVDAVREALGKATSNRQESGWDAEALSFEMTRLLGLVMRNEDRTPAQLDELITLLRKVYAGLFPAYAMSVEQAIDYFCPGQVHEGSGDQPESPLIH